MTLKKEFELLRGEPIAVYDGDPLDIPCREMSDSEKLCKDPVVSVQMITYNHEAYIRQAIESVMAQETDFEFELIIGEDCSQDKTREVCFEYQKRYPEKIRVLWADVNVHNLGGNGRRCRTHCRGEFIALCEGDDYWIDPLKLQKQVDAMRAHPEVTMCFADVEHLYDKTGRYVRYGNVAKTWPEGKIEGDRFVLSGYIAHTGTMMLRRSAYQEAARRWEIFNWHFALGDKQIQLAMSRLGDIWCSHDVVSVYRIQTSGAMRTNGDRVHRDGGLVSLFFESVGASPSIKRMERFRFHVLKYRARIASRMPWKVRMVEVDALAKFGLLPIFDLFMVRLGRPYLMLWYIRKKVKGLGYRLSRVTHA